MESLKSLTKTTEFYSSALEWPMLYLYKKPSITYFKARPAYHKNHTLLYHRESLTECPSLIQRKRKHRIPVCISNSTKQYECNQGK